MKGHSDDELKRILRNELSYRRHTSLKDFRENPALYRVNSISLVDMKVNLAVLLGDDHDHDVTGEEICLPTEEEMVKCLVESGDTTASIAETGESMSTAYTETGDELSMTTDNDNEQMEDEGSNPFLLIHEANQ